MAALNQANNDALRGAISSDKWHKHDHAKWIIDKAQGMTKDLIQSIRDQFEIRSLAAMESLFESEKKRYERHEKLRDEAKSKVGKLVTELRDFIFKVDMDTLVRATSFLNKSQKTTMVSIIKELNKIVKETEKGIKKIEDANKSNDGTGNAGTNFQSIQTACDDEYVEDAGDSIETFDLEAIESWHSKRDGCLREIIKVMILNTNEYNELYATKKLERDAQLTAYYSIGLTVTDDPPIFELIKSLVGTAPPGSNNILQGLKDFTGKLTKKFGKIDLHTHAVIAAAKTPHPHVVEGSATASNNIKLLTTELRFKDASKEEYNSTVSWINMMFANDSLSDSETGNRKQFI